MTLIKKLHINSILKEQFNNLHEKFVTNDNFLKKSKYTKYLEFEGDNLILYHFSSKLFKIISPENFGNNGYTKGDIQAWNKNRSFFYTNDKPNLSDTAVSRDYEYICKVDSNKIYPVHEDPKNYGKGKLDYNKIYNEANKNGYIGFIYSWQKSGANPIVVLWKPIKPFDIKKGDDEITDYDPIGYIEVKDSFGDEYQRELNINKQNKKKFYFNDDNKIIYVPDNIKYKR